MRIREAVRASYKPLTAFNCSLKYSQMNATVVAISGEEIRKHYCTVFMIFGEGSLGSYRLKYPAICEVEYCT